MLNFGWRYQSAVRLLFFIFTPHSQICSSRCECIRGFTFLHPHCRAAHMLLIAAAITVKFITAFLEFL